MPTPTSRASPLKVSAAPRTRPSRSRGSTATATAPSRGRKAASVTAASSNHSTPSAPPLRSAADQLGHDHGQADNAEEPRGRVPLGLAGLYKAQATGEAPCPKPGPVDDAVDHPLVEPVGGRGQGAGHRPDDALLVEVVEIELALQGLPGHGNALQVLAFGQAAPVQGRAQGQPG